MTTDKARKRAVRSRMQKTGERYAAARRHVVRDGDQPALPPLPPRLADPGVSEAAITKGTGQGWDHWFRVLDDWGATSRSHTEIARYVNGEHGVDGWWAQSVTVGYERARGMRALNERPEGFEVSVSKTLAIPAMDAWRAFVEPSRRARWLDLALRMRTGTRTMGRSARFDVPAEGTRVNVYLTPKSPDRTTVTVTLVKLEGADDVAVHRTAWKGRLDRLAAETSAGATAGSRTKVASRGATRRSQAS
jgi:uncharacterized protein YndB with AHSA1/START domain